MFDFLDLFTLVCGGDVKTTAEAAVQEHDKNNDPAEATALEPVDAMNAKNYLIVHLSQPMGILLEENYDAQYGGAFVSEINEGCSAAADGSICRGDQVIAIGDKRVSGMDFDEVIKLIFDSVEMKIKLTLFRGPAESLYGPSGASKEWLDEFVAERGEEAALVEEDSESEVMPDNADVAVSPALLDDVAVDAAAAAAAADAYEFGETVEADQVLVDSESCDETEADAALEVENEVDVDEEVECEAEVEKEVDESVGAVLVEDEVDADVQLAHETEVEKGVDTTVRAVLIEDDADSDEEVAVEAEVEDEAEAAEDVSVVGNDEEVASEAELENEGDGTDEAVLVEEEADSEEQVECEAALETDAPILDLLVSKASKEWLDSYFANPESQLVSDDEMDEADTLGEPTADLETRAKKAAELKEAALAAAVFEKDDSTNAKGILKEPRYSPKGVEELKQLEPSPADTKKSFDDESAVSSVWSEADDYIGQVIDEVPVKRVGSSLAAMGVASTLATAMILN